LSLRRETVVPAALPAPGLGTELGWLGVVVALGVLPRLIVVNLLPTLPVSDFAGVVEMALIFRDRSLVAPGPHWDALNVGPPLVLAALLRLFPQAPAATARLATAIVTGLLPALPFVIWRGVLPRWVRLLAACLLALWPGQVLFAGVVAQDNWVLAPTVALACLTVRCLVSARPHPIAGGMLFATAVAMRQEMLFVLTPLVLASALCGPRSGRARARSALLCAATVAVPFLAMATQRALATGRFALSSGHAGVTLLGTVAPGATLNGWADPAPFVASVRPELLQDRRRFFAETLPIALDEVRRRPLFQIARVLSALSTAPFGAEADDLYWSVRGPGTQPQATRARGLAVAAAAEGPLVVELTLVHGAFLAAVVIGWARRSPAILLVALSVALKVGLHAVLVSTGRFFLPSTALELLVIALGAWEASRWRAWRTVAACAFLGLALSAGSARAGIVLRREVLRRDPTGIQRLYFFRLHASRQVGVLDCKVEQGRLREVAASQVVLGPVHDGPAVGDTISAICRVEVSGSAASSLVLSLVPYQDGPRLADNLRLTFSLDGREVAPDIGPAATGSALTVRLGKIEPGSHAFLRLRGEVQPTPAGAQPGASFVLTAQDMP
jgi:hypothetical protein